MSRTRVRSPLAALLGLSLLTGCGAGLDPQTYRERASADATNTAVGQLALRNLAVLPPSSGPTYQPGSEARMSMTVVNQGQQPDRLVAVRTAVAGSVTVVRSSGPVPSLEVPALGTAEGYFLALKGLTRSLRPGEYIAVDMQFAVNGQKQILVPVALTGSPAPRRPGYKVGETDSAGDPIGESTQEPLDTGRQPATTPVG